MRGRSDGKRSSSTAERGGGGSKRSKEEEVEEEEIVPSIAWLSSSLSALFLSVFLPPSLSLSCRLS